MKYDFLTANANTKVVNLASNVAAVVTFMAAGKVDYRIGMIVLLFAKIAWDFIAAAAG